MCIVIRWPRRSLICLAICVLFLLLHSLRAAAISSLMASSCVCGLHGVELQVIFRLLLISDCTSTLVARYHYNGKKQ